VSKSVLYVAVVRESRGAAMTPHMSSGPHSVPGGTERWETGFYRWRRGRGGRRPHDAGRWQLQGPVLNADLSRPPPSP
jgi:hypothetical protein